MATNQQAQHAVADSSSVLDQLNCAVAIANSLCREPVITPAEELRARVIACKTKYAQIVLLASEGFATKAIAAYLSEVHGKTVLYQHVRNELERASRKAD